MKLPPFGRELATRLKFGNPPFHTVITIGMDAWRRCREWQRSPNDVGVLVLPDGDNPTAYAWPVTDQLVVIEAACGPTDADLRDLAAVLLAYDADVITIVSRDGSNVFKQYVAERREAA